MVFRGLEVGHAYTTQGRRRRVRSGNRMEAGMARDRVHEPVGLFGPLQNTLFRYYVSLNCCVRVAEASFRRRVLWFGLGP